MLSDPGIGIETPPTDCVSDAGSASNTMAGTVKVPVAGAGRARERRSGPVRCRSAYRTAPVDLHITSRVAAGPIESHAIGAIDRRGRLLVGPHQRQRVEV